MAREPKVNEKEDEGAVDNNGIYDSLVKLTKLERRAKLKKSKKEAKQQVKNTVHLEEVQGNSQAEALAEIKDLSAEKLFEVKKNKLAELGISLPTDPEANINSLKEIIEIYKDEDHDVVNLGLLSLLVAFKDIIPGYVLNLMN
ncbi:hypothetical protein GIB67_039685 [Kingdonia uniflora]|uniref:Nucleolar complex-associated protein 3 N-terminal domain-containing protein n=1 Tax=Kingdonia uniflora TaxID=39325 RepID=A0A7J7MQ09_9MAGN|nr:hypothetical protein GIB67_039685 [Kingdonia uniflora]